MFNTTKKLACVIALTVAYGMAPAHAGLFNDDEARNAILDLRAKLQAQETSMKTQLDLLQQKADKSGLLDINNHLESLQQELNNLRGTTEVLTNTIQTLQLRQKDLYADLDKRLRILEPKVVTVDGQEASVQNTEKDDFSAAASLFKKAEYKAAVAALTSFTVRYPNSVYQPLALNTLGNSYYVLNDYKNAVQSYKAIVAKYPQSTVVPDSMLTMAICYLELKNKPEAKKTLEYVINEYAGTDAAKTAKDRLRSLH